MDALLRAAKERGRSRFRAVTDVREGSPAATLKLYRRVEPGEHPEVEITGHLADVGFTHAPLLAAVIDYTHATGTSSSLGIFTCRGSRWKARRTDGRMRWTGWAGCSTRSWRSNCRSPPDTRRIHSTRRRLYPSATLMNTYLDVAATLGCRTAEMHLALAADATDARFAPEPLGKEDLDIAVQRALAHAERTLASLEAALAMTPLRVPADAALLGRTILDARSHLLDRIRSAASLDSTGIRIRIHGDYRLGQVVLAEGDIYIQNIEGHLSWPAAAQRDKLSPLRDVAGLLRSFSYAAHVALLARGTSSPDQLAHLARWARAWETWATVSFLRAYYASAAASPVLPGDTGGRDGLLQFFMVDRSLRELDGELNNRPEWVGVPLGGLLGLLGLR